MAGAHSDVPPGTHERRESRPNWRGLTKHNQTDEKHLTPETSAEKGDVAAAAGDPRSGPPGQARDRVASPAT
jgi:hypothetical protein